MILDKDHERVGKWIEKHGGGFWREGAKCVGLEENGELVAGVMYDWCNGASIYAHIAAKNLTRHFIWFAFYYPFCQLNVNVMIGLISDGNDKSKELVSRLGFVLHTKIPHADPSGDLLVYLMEKERCKWLRKHHET